MALTPEQLQILRRAANPQANQGGIAGILPTVGGVVGGIGGSLLGPVGSVAGGAGGSALGEYLRQKITGEDNTGKILTEGALGLAGGAIGEGIGLAGRALIGAGKGAVGKAAVKSGAKLVRPAGKASSSIGRGLESGADRLASRSVGATKTLQREFKDKFGVSLGKALRKEGAVGIGPEDFIENRVRPLQNAYTAAVENTNARLPFSQVVKNFDDRISILRRSSVPQVQKQADALQAIRDSLAKKFGKKNISAGLLNAEKLDFQAYATPSLKLTDPSDFKVADISAGILRDAVDQAVGTTGQKVGGMGLKEAGKELNRLYTLGDAIASGEYAGGRGTVSFRNLLFGTAGASVGGPVGAGAGIATDALLNSKVAQRGLVGALGGAGEALQAPVGALGSMGLAGASQLLTPRGLISGQAGLEQPGIDELGAPSQRLADFRQPAQEQQSTGTTEGILDRIDQAILADIEETGGKNIDKLIKISEYFKSKTETQEKPKGIEATKLQNLAKSGLRNLTEVENFLQKDPSLLLKSKATLGLGTRQFDSALFGAVEALLRARSGAAVPEQEVRRYMKNYAPRLGDTRAVAQRKIDRLRLDFEDALGSAGQTDAVGSLLEQLAGGQ